LPLPKKSVVEEQKNPQILLHYKKTDQTHFCLGSRAFGLNDPRIFALEIMAVILGGNMSSRLFVEMREKRGLCYYVKTEDEEFTDHGYIVSQVGCHHEKLGEAVSLIIKECVKIKKELVSEEILRQAKDYLIGTMDLEFENSSVLSSFYGLQELLSGKILTVEEKKEKIEKVSREDLRCLAKEIFVPQSLNLAVIGPHKNKADIVSRLKI
jgi:predicted Zn-dependent peptidase